MLLLHILYIDRSESLCSCLVQFELLLYVSRIVLTKYDCPMFVDWSDIVHPDVYAQWRRLSTKNSAVYDEIDGAMSLYRCVTIADYKRALENAHLRSYLDPDTQLSLSEISGFLVDWPQSLFTREDLSPSLATRAMIPNELWV